MISSSLSSPGRDCGTGGIPPVRTLLGAALLGGSGGGARVCAGLGGRAEPGPGIGGTLLALWADVTGRVGEVGDAAAEPTLVFSWVSTVAVACGCRGLLGSDGMGPVWGIAEGPSRIEGGTTFLSEFVCVILRFRADVSSSDSELSSGSIDCEGGGRGSGRAIPVSMQTKVTFQMNCVAYIQRVQEAPPVL